MISKMTQALILSGCLIAAGTASAGERNVIVPVIAGAVVGAVVAGALSGPVHEHHYYRPAYQGYYQQPVYQPVYQPVAYVPAPPPRPYYYGGHYRHDDYYRYDHRPGYGRW